MFHYYIYSQYNGFRCDDLTKKYETKISEIEVKSAKKISTQKKTIEALKRELEQRKKRMKVLEKKLESETSRRQSLIGRVFAGSKSASNNNSNMPIIDENAPVAPPTDEKPDQDYAKRIEKERKQFASCGCRFETIKDLLDSRLSTLKQDFLPTDKVGTERHFKVARDQIEIMFLSNDSTWGGKYKKGQLGKLIGLKKVKNNQFKAVYRANSWNANKTAECTLNEKYHGLYKLTNIKSIAEAKVNKCRFTYAGELHHCGATETEKLQLLQQQLKNIPKNLKKPLTEPEKMRNRMSCM